MIHFPVHNAIMRHDKLDLIHGEIVFFPEMPVVSIFLIEKGGVMVFSPIGIQVSKILVSGQVVGIQDLLSSGSWTGLGVAHGPTQLRAIPTERLRARIAGAPPAHRALLTTLAAP